jgi:hypothetical protein
MSRVFRAVLFDWRGTLFHDEDEADFIRASAVSIGRTLTSAEVNALVERLPGAPSIRKSSRRTAPPTARPTFTGLLSCSSWVSLASITIWH